MAGDDRKGRGTDTSEHGQGLSGQSFPADPDVQPALSGQTEQPQEPEWDPGPEEELEMILNSVYDDIVITDGRGVVLRASRSCQRVYGRSPEELVGQSVAELERQGIFRPSITLRVLATGTRQTVIQTTADGSKKLVTATPVFDFQGRIVRVVSYSRDVTELIELKEHLAELQQQMGRVTRELEHRRSLDTEVDGLVVESGAMKRLVRQMAQLAKHDVTVLLRGESGVGKGVFARYLHQHSPRAEGPFIEINSGALPESLAESELFGYEQGTFTGALKSGKIGLIELAHGGTLFLDEVGDLPLPLQVKLLKVIQEKTFYRVGGRAPVHSDFRLIAATNRDLEALVRAGAFREDLFYRLNTVPLTIPPLRERREDIPGLAGYFLERYNAKYHARKRIDPRALRQLVDYPWPGNVRELENLIERLVLLVEGEVIQPTDLPFGDAAGNGHRMDDNLSDPLSPGLGALPLPDLVAAYERHLLDEARRRCRSTTEMASLLGVSQPTVVRKLRRYFGSTG
ncbi:sigma 54-interacting transcriptional regulator [Kyrpidia sp.]|uniref:sigma-54 interaction domain-containing protein n=1 Tax=Kyrpidia sp. TaxID=2073077 RepID=UPI0025907E42|nr:sigma 54-interacting transcriptional regulator [Kyrpidia sp.]